MSKGQLARTAANFPRMKYRARKRHARNFERSLRIDPDFAAALGTSLGAFVEHVAAMARTIRAHLETEHFQRVAAMRRPWFEYLAEAEARGAHGSGELGFGQCECPDCEKADIALLKRTPIEDILAKPCTCDPGACNDPWASGCTPAHAADHEDPSDLPDHEVAAMWPPRPTPTTARTSTMNDRDQEALADLIFWEFDGGEAEPYELAGALLAKGVRPPAPVITDPNTPDTYAARTVGIDRDGEVWVSRHTDWIVAFDVTARGERLGDIVADVGPLTIVYVPTEEAGWPT